MSKKTTIKKMSSPAKDSPVSPRTGSKPKSLMLVYGFGEDLQPRAAVFQEADFKLAKKAAGLLQLKFLVGTTENFVSALKGINSGKVHAPGSGFAPEIDRARFDELLAALQLTAPPAPTTAPKLPTTWASVEPGDYVMAQADSKEDGWWPVVCEGLEGDVLRLRSLDFPEIVVRRHRCAVALGYTPAYMPPEGLAEAAPGLPKGWDSLAIGHLVIALESRADGSFEALITKIESGKITMRWRDFPKLAAFSRTVAELALLCPALPEQPKATPPQDTTS